MGSPSVRPSLLHDGLGDARPGVAEVVPAEQLFLVRLQLLSRLDAGMSSLEVARRQPVWQALGLDGVRLPDLDPYSLLPSELRRSCWSALAVVALVQPDERCQLLTAQEVLGEDVRCVSSPSTLRKTMRLALIACWIHRAVVSRCLSFPKPCLEEMPIDAVLSVKTVAGTSTPKSRIKAW